MTTKPKKRSVKGWAVIDKKGVMFAETTEPTNDMYLGSGRMAKWDEVQVVPCEITYSI
jgi:hypothetical protein